MTQYLTYLESGLGFSWETDEKKQFPPPQCCYHCREEKGGGGVWKGTKFRVAAFPPLLSMKQPVVMVGMHARGCVFTCVLYEANAIHYLFISPVCLAAIVCTSACLTIIMPHALFKAHADSDAHSYTSYSSPICLLIALSAFLSLSVKIILKNQTFIFSLIFRSHINLQARSHTHVH